MFTTLTTARMHVRLSCCLLLAAGLYGCDDDPAEPGAGSIPGIVGSGGRRAGGSGGAGGSAGLGSGGASVGGAGVDAVMPEAGDGPGSMVDAIASDGSVGGEGPLPVADGPGSEGAPGDAVAADGALAVAQNPPQGRRLLDPWLAAGHYRSWKCEPAAVNPRPGSPHGRNRVCSNDLLSRHGTGPYPVGAAAVKEIFFGARVGVFAVSLKIKEGTTGDAWYWYEQNDLEGVGAAGCTGCHSRAARSGGNDFVYIQVK